MNKQPNKEYFEQLCKELENPGKYLTLVDVHRVFGEPFFEIMMMQVPQIKVVIEDKR